MADITYQTDGRDSMGWRVIRVELGENPQLKPTARMLIGRASEAAYAAQIAAALNRSWAFCREHGYSREQFRRVERSYFESHVQVKQVRACLPGKTVAA